MEILKVTSVIEEGKRGVYAFTVPDYPRILNELRDTNEANLNRLEKEVKDFVQKYTKSNKNEGEQK